MVEMEYLNVLCFNSLKHTLLQYLKIVHFEFLQLSFDLLESWMAKNPDAAGFKRDGQSIFRELALFQDYHGLPAFKKVS